MKGRLLPVLFAAPFLAVGFWAGGSIGLTLYQASKVQAWTQVDATLHSAGFTTHSGDDTDTYEAYAEYSYSYAGQSYLNDRVAISNGADNIGDYQQETGRRLSGAWSRGEKVTVFVNPLQPDEAILDPSIRWGLLGFKAIFLLVFGGVGAGMIFWAFKAPPEKSNADPVFPDSPWRLNDDWQSATIASSARRSMWFAWGFAALWNLISAPLPFVLYSEVVEKDNTIALVGLLFPLVGIGLLWWAISRTLEWRRFGSVPLQLDPFPGSLGGHVGGTIDVELPYDPQVQFRITLTSIHSYLSGSGEDRRRSESAKWQDTQVAHVTSGSKGTRLSFRFDVPADLAESDADQSTDAYNLWRLNLKAELPGVDIDRDYEIPVYAAARKSSGLSEFSIRAAKSAQADMDTQLVQKLFSLERGLAGKTMRFPMGRNLGSGIGGSLFGGIFAAIGGFLWVSAGHVLMSVVFGLVGTVILLGSLYFIFNSLEITQSGDSLRTVRRILGIPVKRQEMRRRDFERFRKDSSMTTQSGGKHVVHYTLYAVGADGQELVVGEGFRGASQVEAAAQFIARELGLTGTEKRPDSSEEFVSYNVLTAD
jgi:hypothetical protein